MALKPRKIQKTGKQSLRLNTERIGLECKECGNFVDNLSGDTKAVTCDRCVAKIVTPPDFKPKAIPTGRPRGWQLKKEYIAPDGRRYIRGREVDANTTSNMDNVSRAKKQYKKSTKAKPVSSIRNTSSDIRSARGTKRGKQRGT